MKTFPLMYQLQVKIQISNFFEKKIKVLDFNGVVATLEDLSIDV